MSELVTVEKQSIPMLFKEGGLTSIIDDIKSKVSEVSFDVETKDGRKEIASLANKIARSKTYLDSLGKDLVSDIKKQSKAIDNERKRMRDTLDILKIQVRKPLSDWEEFEANRVKKLSQKVLDIVSSETATYSTSADIKCAIDLVFSITVDSTWQEFEDQGKREKERVLSILRGKYAEYVLAEKQREEEEKARQEREKKAQEERDARIAQEAAAKAKRDAEEKAAKEIAEAKQRESQALLEKERLERKLSEPKATVTQKVKTGNVTPNSVSAEIRTAFIHAGLSALHAGIATSAIMNNEIPHVTISGEPS